MDSIIISDTRVLLEIDCNLEHMYTNHSWLVRERETCNATRKFSTGTKVFDAKQSIAETLAYNDSKNIKENSLSKYWLPLNNQSLVRFMLAFVTMVMGRDNRSCKSMMCGGVREDDIVLYVRLSHIRKISR